MPFILDKWRDEDDDVTERREPALVLTYDEALDKHRPLDDYEQGLVDGLYRHAWMKDGVYYVGTGIYTLGQAVDDALTIRRQQ